MNVDKLLAVELSEMHWLPRLMFGAVKRMLGIQIVALLDWLKIAILFAIVIAALLLLVQRVRRRRVSERSAVFASLLLAATLLSAGTVHAKDHLYRPARLSDGRPDLQGTWDHSNATPLARLQGFDTLVISKDQAALIDKIIQALFLNQNIPNDPDNDLSHRRVEPIRGEYRSSIIVDPPDGKLPGTAAFHEWSKRVVNELFLAMDGPEQRPSSERCISDLAAQAPILYNPGMNLHQIVQTEDTILFFSEAMHEARVIRMHSKHAPAAVTSWLGDSIGWWDGDTLVVQTKHLTPSDTGRPMPFATYRLSPQATVTERFTRVAEDKIDYAFSVDDPVNYTKTWSGETQFWRSDEQLFEYSCHEGNHSLTYILQGARVNEGAWPKK